MAVLKGSIINGLISGRLGGNVYSIRNGKNYVRSVRKIEKFSEATLARQAVFSKGAKLCKSLRQQLLTIEMPVERHIMQSNMMRSILGWTRDWEKGNIDENNSMIHFGRCKFTDSEPLKDRWHVALQVSYIENGLLRLHIPAFVPDFHIKAPRHTSSVECTIAVAGAMPHDATATGCFSTVAAGYMVFNNTKQTTLSFC